jgi:predicted metal-binding protein
VKKELLKNNDSLLIFTSKYEEKIKLQKELEFPLHFCRGLLIDVLSKLEKIKTEYFYFDNEMLFEKPNCLYILAQKIEDLNKKIEADELKFYNDEYLDAKQQSNISKLKEEKEQFLIELKKNQDRDIYKEFLKLQFFIEQNSFENLFEKSELTERNFEILKYIYNCVKEFNARENKSKSDVSLLYNKLVIFKISSDIIQGSKFEQDTFDLYYKNFEEHTGFEKSLYDMCEEYYKLVAADNFIDKYKFSIYIQKWNDNSSELVLLSDSDLYISINELYEKFEKLETNFEEEKLNELQDLYSYVRIISQAILEVITRLEKHQSKIKKWCK